MQGAHCIGRIFPNTYDTSWRRINEWLTFSRLGSKHLDECKQTVTSGLNAPIYGLIIGHFGQ